MRVNWEIGKKLMTVPCQLAFTQSGLVIPSGSFDVLSIKTFNWQGHTVTYGVWSLWMPWTILGVLAPFKVMSREKIVELRLSSLRCTSLSPMHSSPPFISNLVTHHDFHWIYRCLVEKSTARLLYLAFLPIGYSFDYAGTSLPATACDTATDKSEEASQCLQRDLCRGTFGQTQLPSYSNWVSMPNVKVIKIVPIKLATNTRSKHNPAGLWSLVANTNPYKCM